MNLLYYYNKMWRNKSIFENYFLRKKQFLFILNIGETISTTLLHIRRFKRRKNQEYHSFL